MGKQIECKNCTLGYEGVPVTEGINFTVNSGDYLCILGENGSGKSTLIKRNDIFGIGIENIAVGT